MQSQIMKSFIVIASSLLLCSCADMVVTKSSVSSSEGRARATVDAKDFDAKDGVHYETCGVGAANPVAIYIRPFSGAMKPLPTGKCRFAKRSLPSPLPMI